MNIRKTATTATIILLIAITIIQQHQITQLYTLTNQNKQNTLKQYLLQNYGVETIDELIQKKLKEYRLHYTGNPFTTALYPGQLQAENITGMHWYTYLSGQLLNRTDVLAYPEQIASYVIFGKDTDGDGVYDIISAKNCTSGQIEFNRTDAATVIQLVLDGLPSGGKVFIKNGVYTTSSPPISVKVNNSCVIEGETWNTVLKGIAFEVHSAPVQIRNLQIDMEGTNFPCIDIRDFTNEWKYIENCLLKGGCGCVHIMGCDESGARYANGKVIIKNCELWNVNSPAWGSIIWEQATYDIWIIANKFYESNKPFLEAYGDSPFNPIDDVFVLFNEFVGPQTGGDPSYPQALLSRNGGNCYVIGNVFKPREESGLDTYKNKGMILSGSYVLFANNILQGCELEIGPGESRTKATEMIVAVTDARCVEIIGNIFFGDACITTSYKAADIESLKISNNVFYHNRLSAISLGNSGTDAVWKAKVVEITDNLIIDWDFSNTYFYSAIHTSGRSDTYPATIERLIIKNNRFVKLSDGTYGNVGNTVLGNDPYPPAHIDIDTLIVEDNLFDCTHPIGDLGSITPTTQIIKCNVGYVTENSGTTTVANGEYIAHGLDSSLNIGASNSTVLITEYTKVYDGVPVTVGCDFVNATHIRVSVYWTNGTAITDDAIQIWWQVKYTG